MAKFSRSNGMPLYLQAMEGIRRMIEREGLVQGDRLPSLDVLAERFGIARLTMRQAVKRLEEEGVLVTGRGKGIVLAQERRTPPKMRLTANFSEFMNLSRGSTVQTLLQENVQGCPLVADAPADRTYRRWTRVHSDHGVPYGYLDIYLDSRYYKKKPGRFDREPTMHVATELPELAGASYRQVLSIRTASAEESTHLQVTGGSPVADILRTGRTKDGELFYAAAVVYPGSQLRIDMALRLPGLFDNHE